MSFEVGTLETEAAPRPLTASGPQTDRNALMMRLVPCAVLVLVGVGAVVVLPRLMSGTQDGGFSCTSAQLAAGCAVCSDENHCTECGTLPHSGPLQLTDLADGRTCSFPCTRDQAQVDNNCTLCVNDHTCRTCASGYHLEAPPKNAKYAYHLAACQFSCTPSQKARSCTRCNGPNSCDTCSSGYELLVSDPTADPPDETCSFLCTDDQKAKGCTACDSASKCVQCRKGYKVVEDDFGTGASHCRFLCTVPGTNVSIEDEYPQDACETCQPPDSHRCEKCREGYHLHQDPGPILDPDGKCIADPGPKELDFYMYQAKDDTENPNDGISNVASVGGVLGYLHTQIVSSEHVGTAKPQGGCKRKFNIQKIQRWHVRMRNTPMVYKERRGQFSKYVSFDAGQCTFGAPSFTLCKEMWRKYGYVVGCQTDSIEQFKYPDAISYSFPGQCPQEQASNKKVGDCFKRAPGGQCGKKPGGDGEFGHPDGSPFCTYDMKLEGEVSLDQLVGLCNEPMCQRFHQFCMGGGVEYRCPPSADHPECTDNGVLPFWTNYQDEDRNRARIKALEDLFQRNFPNSPRKSTPVCDEFESRL